MLKSVKVMGKRHAVRWNARNVPNDRWGDFDPNEHVIRIGKAPNDQQRETFLHELLHAIEVQYDIELSEEAIRLMAKGLFATMRENPGLAAKVFGEG